MFWFRKKIRVVAVIAGASDRALLSDIASRANWALELPRSFENAVAALQQNPAAVVLCDRDLAQWDWRKGMETLRARYPGSRMILATGATDDKLWLEVLERGGFDVVTRPFHSRRLIEAISRAWSEIRK